MSGRAVVGRLGDVGLEDRADRADMRRAGVRSSMSSSLAPILPICGKVKVTIWPSIGRVGEDFLVAGHRGVEADFGLHLAGGAETWPRTTVPSAKTSTAVGFFSVQGLVVMSTPFTAEKPVSHRAEAP
jgi:hypothetical protein